MNWKERIIAEWIQKESSDFTDTFTVLGHFTGGVPDNIRKTAIDELSKSKVEALNIKLGLSKDLDVDSLKETTVDFIGKLFIPLLYERIVVQNLLNETSADAEHIYNISIKLNTATSEYFRIFLDENDSKIAIRELEIEFQKIMDSPSIDIGIGEIIAIHSSKIISIIKVLISALYHSALPKMWNVDKKDVEAQ